MPNQYTSALYHLGTAKQIPPGRLVHVEEYEGAWTDIYFHPLHIRNPLIWDLNRVSRHRIGNGLWRHRWIREGRMQQPVEGLGVAVPRWEIVPSSEMPRNRTVFATEEDGACIWNIRAGYCTTDLRDEMNQMLERIVRDGLWLQAWYEWPERPRSSATLAPLTTPAVSLSA